MVSEHLYSVSLLSLDDRLEAVREQSKDSYGHRKAVIDWTRIH